MVHEQPGAFSRLTVRLPWPVSWSRTASTFCLAKFASSVPSFTSSPCRKTLSHGPAFLDEQVFERRWGTHQATPPALQLDPRELGRATVPLHTSRTKRLRTGVAQNQHPFPFSTPTTVYFVFSFGIQGEGAAVVGAQARLAYRHVQEWMRLAFQVGLAAGRTTHQRRRRQCWWA
jgi:hypothetical protein